MIEREYTERSHSGQNRVALDHEGSAQGKAGRRTARAASRKGGERSVRGRRVGCKRRRAGCQRAASEMQGAASGPQGAASGPQGAPARCPACAALQPARCPALQPARHPCSLRAALWQPARRPFAALLALPCLCRPAAAAVAGGAGPPTDRHYLSWLLSRQLQRLGVDNGGHCLSQTTPPLSSFTSGFFSEPVQASRCFFRDCTSLTPLAAPVPVSLADPTGGPVVARASTLLPCPAVPSGSLSGLHLPTILTNLVSNAAIQDVWVDTFMPGGKHVAICPCSQTGRHLATFTRRPGSSLYTLTTATAQVAEAGQVAASSQVSASGQLAASCSCRVPSHQTLLWHHCLGHPSLPRLRGMHSRLLVSGLPRSVPPLPCLHALPCLPCVEGRQRAAPHSSEFPPTTAPLHTLHMDVWGPALVSGTDQERYFLLVVDDYTCYTTVFPLRRKADVSGVLIPWICATRRQLREQFSRDFPVLSLHSDRGGEFSSDLLAEFYRDEGIPFAVRYAAHQLNLWPRVSEPETSPTLWWTGNFGDVSAFWVWGALSLVRDAKASKLSSRTLRCVFLGFPTDAPSWQLYHAHSCRVFSSQDVTFDDSVCYYRLHPHASHPGPAPSDVSQVDPPPLVEPLEISSDSSGLAEGGDPAADDTAATRCSPSLETPPGFPPRPSSTPPQPAAVESGAETAGAEPGGVETEGEGSVGAATKGAVSWGAATGGADSGGPACPSGGGAVGDPTGGLGAGQPPQPNLLETLSPQAIRASIVWRGSPDGGGYGLIGAGAASPRGTAGAGGTGGAASAGGTRGAAGAGGARATSPRGATGAAGAGPTSPGGTAGAGGAGGAAGARVAGAGGTGGAGATDPRGARTRGAGAAGAGGAVSARGATGAAGAGGAVSARGATGAAGSGGTGGTAGAGGAGAAGAGATAGAGGAGGATGAAGTGGAGGGAGAGGTGAGGTGGAVVVNNQ
ncbi:unnamed protein product [Closterium sp. NIES-54]